ncbi:hypothetical protein KGF57_004645 [Candida theae]|uniref:Pre-mRNA processing factor 4 (PRP4)-like domain-containing protein n=1 Tax=Candida theae TaxID=1198502 RepID=A0AAD5FWU9_9ASCO|nr:uncharacterized protein KGF57_004645 [Candida theae]KAI5949822.1 hypothetical protein KGF57_004645 [Candida theae]
MQYNEIPIINDNPIPEEDELVRQQLKQLGQPVFINGENDSDRRERLSNLVNGDSSTDPEQGDVDNDDDEDDDNEDDDDVFYTPGPANLYDVRRQILSGSLKLASQRLQRQRHLVKINPELIPFLQNRRDMNSRLSGIELYGSQIVHGNTRAISSVRYSPRGDLIACGTWDGSVHVLNSIELNPTTKLSGGEHTEKVGGVDWKANDSGDVLITGGSEGTINLWNIEESDETIKPNLSIKEAHSSRITKTMFHPVQDYAISTSFDQTWKLWDMNRGTELYQQEGHSREVYSGAIHPDGSLFLSGGLDGVIYVWDLRSGRALMPLQKHTQGIYCLDWSPNGYYFASGSGDCSVKIWDMRKLDHSGDEIFSIPAHTKLISDVRFYGGGDKVKTEGMDLNGSFLVSCSYDGTVKIWSSDNWILVNTLKGHNEKVMSCDIGASTDKEVNIVSSGWDRTVKLWK